MVNLIANIILSIILAIGSVYSVFEKNYFLFLALTLGWLLTSTYLYKKYYKKRVTNNIITNVFWMVNLFVLYLSSGELMKECYRIYFVGMMAIIIGLVMVLFISDWSASKMSVSVLIMCYILLFMNYLVLINVSDYWYGAISYIVGIMVIIITECKKKKWDADRIILCLISIVCMWKGLGMFGPLFDRLVVFLLCIPFMTYGIYKKSPIHKYAGGIFLYLYFSANVNEFEKMIVLIMAFAFMYYLISKKEDTSINWALLHILILLAIDDIGYQVLVNFYDTSFKADAIVYFFITVINIIMLYFAMNTKRNMTIYQIVNVLAIIKGMIFSMFVRTYLLVIVVLTLAFIVNSKRAWVSKSKILRFYLAFKLLVYAIFITMIII